MLCWSLPRADPSSPPTQDDNDHDDDEDHVELTEGFWQEFFLHRPDSAGLKRILSAMSPDDMLHRQAHSQQLFARAIQRVQHAAPPSDEVALEVRRRRRCRRNMHLHLHLHLHLHTHTYSPESLTHCTTRP